MTITLTSVINTPVVVYFKAAPGTSSFADRVIFSASGSVLNPTISTLEVLPGLYSFTYTPSITGLHTFYVASQIICVVEVVAKSAYTFLKNIEDESLGSWSWDKISGVMNLVRQDGTFLNSYTISDTNDAASRELH